MGNKLALLGVAASLVTGGGGGGSNPVVVANDIFNGGASSHTYSSLSGMSCAAGSVVYALLLLNVSFPTSLKDSVDSSVSWTQPQGDGPSSMNMGIFYRVVPAGGFDATTTFTATFGGSVTSASLMVINVPATTSAPGNTGVVTATGSTITATVAAPTTTPSFQIAGVGTSVISGSVKDVSSDASWNTFAANGATAGTSDGWGIRAYWRAAAAGGTTTLAQSGPFSLNCLVYGEAH